MPPASALRHDRRAAHRQRLPPTRVPALLVILLSSAAFLLFFVSLSHPKHNLATTEDSSAATMSKKALSAFAAAATSSSSSSSCASSNILPKMPLIGLGTMGLDGADTVRSAIQSAITLGYRRIDCAPVYFNEEHIGDALHSIISNREMNVKREDLFITSKLPCPYHRKEHVELALKKTLSDLRLDFLDLYLIHWPVAFHFVGDRLDTDVRGYPDELIDDSNDGRNIDPTVSIHETWEAMEDVRDKGLVKHIGVSNFPVSLLHELMTKCRTKPEVNQVELHPYLPQTKLLKYCEKRGVHVQAYSPLGTPGYKESTEPNLLQDEVLVGIAKGKNVTVAQLCLAWAAQRGTSVVSKSANPRRQEENLLSGSETITLTREEMARIGTVGKTLRHGHHRFFRPEDWWGEMGMAVFD